MSRKTSFPLLTLCALALATSSAFGRNVFVMPPGDGVLRPVTPFVGDPFAPGAGAIAAAQDSFIALATPSGNKYYFVGRSSTDTIVITDSNYSVLARRSLGTGATAAAMTPDGRYVIVLAGSVQFLRTSDDQVQTQLDAGTNPIDVAVSRDGTKAFVISSGRLTSIDLGSLSILGTLQNLGPVNGVSVGPNGLVYVGAQNALYEVDPRDLSLRGGGAIQLNAQAGKPTFATDDFGTVRVLMVNMNPAFGGSSLVTVDLGTGLATTLLAGGVIFDRVIPVSANRAYATSAITQQLYDITLPNNFTNAAFSGLSSTSGVRAAVASNEVPNPRYLYLAFSNNTISRIDLQSNALSGSFPLSTGAGALQYTGPATTGSSPSRVITYNNQQFVNPSSQTLPLIIRAIDATGKPLSGVPVSWSAGSSSFIVSSTGTTDAEGFAQAIALSPNSFGTFTITANVGSGTVVTTNFNITVGTGQVGPTGALTIKSGNGQIVRESAVTPELLRVVVRDTAGSPVSNAVVNWTVTTLNGPNGSLNLTQSVTDFFGEATNTYIAPIIGPNLFQSSYIQSAVTASTAAGNTVTFYVTVIPNVFGNPPNPASFPTVTLLQPVNTDTITGQAGTTITGAIQVRVTAGSGPASGSAIPNVAVSASTGLDPTIAPSASCRQDNNAGLTDTNGVANCDLILGNKIGITQLTITAGGNTISTLNLIVTPGLPGKIVPLQGDNQVGNPGVTLPLALLARVEDSFGNALPNAPVTWTVESGGATLVNTIVRSDNQARVSTLVRLGNTPGPVRIRVTAVGGIAAATTTFTATTNITATTFRKVSGDEQSAIVNQAFGEALVAQLLDANNQPVPGVSVTFSVRSGSVTLGTPTAVSDNSGNVRTTVTAGSVAGTATVSADFGNSSVSWTLTVRPLGPTLSANGITNAATGQTSIAPGSIATIRGTNIASGVRGYVLPALDYGPRPTILAGVTVTFGGTAAPIFWVSNVDGAEAVTVQVPFEAPENSSVPVTVTSGGTSATVNVQIAPVAPGIFENVDSSGRRYAVVTRADGTFVTPDNPIARGEQGRIFATGLGRTNAPASTNSYGGANQRLTASVVVGLNDGGVRLISAEYAQNLIGVYIVTFEVPSDTITGSNRNLAIAVDAGGGNFVYGNGSNIAIR